MSVRACVGGGGKAGTLLTETEACEAECREAHMQAFRHPYDVETMEYDDGGDGGGSSAPADGAGTAAAAGGSNAEGSD
jgi:hypothetical protein